MRSVLLRCAHMIVLITVRHFWYLKHSMTMEFSWYVSMWFLCIRELPTNEDLH